MKISGAMEKKKLAFPARGNINNNARESGPETSWVRIRIEGRSTPVRGGVSVL